MTYILWVRTTQIPKKNKKTEVESSWFPTSSGPHGAVVMAPPEGMLPSQRWDDLRYAPFCWPKMAGCGGLSWMIWDDSKWFEMIGVEFGSFEIIWDDLRWFEMIWWFEIIWDDSKWFEMIWDDIVDCFGSIINIPWMIMGHKLLRKQWYHRSMFWPIPRLQRIWTWKGFGWKERPHTEEPGDMRLGEVHWLYKGTGETPVQKDLLYRSIQYLSLLVNCCWKGQTMHFRCRSAKFRDS